MSKKEKNNIEPEKIHLLKIEPIEVLISDLMTPFNQEETIEMKIAHISAHNIDNKGFFLGLEIILELADRKPEKEARFRYNFHFTIDNIEKMYELIEEGEPKFSKQFVATLAGISYSTLRGIIFEKLLHSSWGAVTVPVINPNKILDSWIYSA
jgi:hypothetical protein